MLTQALENEQFRKAQACFMFVDLIMQILTALNKYFDKKLFVYLDVYPVTLKALT